MKKFLRKNGILLITIAVLLAILLGIGVSVLGYNPISGILNTLGTPFRAVSTAVTNWMEDRYDRAFRYEQLVEENEQLRQQLAELEEAARNGQDAIREVEYLRELLKLSNQRPELTYVDAAVTRGSSTNWGSDMTLNKGTRSGVSVNDCVIDKYGNVVGVVTEVGVNWSLVTTILDPRSELGGRIARINENVILEGDFTLMQEGKLKLSYLPADSKLVSGDQVATSGIGELLPEGLFIGTVRTLHTEADGISRYAVVDPGADIENLRYVFIITDFTNPD